MNKIKIFLLNFAIMLGLLVPELALAQTVTPTATPSPSLSPKERIKEMKEELKERKKEIREEIKEDKKEMKEELKERKKELKEEVKEMKENLKEEKKGLLEQIKEKFTGRGIKIVNGQIKAISGNVLTVTDDGKDYIVNVDSDTKFRRRFWGKSSLSELSVGNKVNVWGKWTDDAKTSIDARMIRNLSIQKRNGVFFGNVLSKGSNTFVMKSINRGDQTVTVSSSTKLIDKNGNSIPFADIKVEDRVRVRGLWDRVANTITEVTEVKNFGPKVEDDDDKSSPSVTPTSTPTVTITPTITPTATPTPTVTTTI